HLSVAVELVHLRFLGDDIDGAAECIASAYGALRAYVHFDTIDVEEGYLQTERPRDVDIVEMRRYGRISKLRIGITADAAQVDIRVVFVVRYFDARQYGRYIDQVGGTQRIELRLRGSHRRTGIALQRLRHALDRNNHLRQ